MSGAPMYTASCSKRSFIPPCNFASLSFFEGFELPACWLANAGFTISHIKAMEGRPRPLFLLLYLCFLFRLLHTWRPAAQPDLSQELGYGLFVCF